MRATDPFEFMDRSGRFERPRRFRGMNRMAIIDRCFIAQRRVCELEVETDEGALALNIQRT